MTTLPGPDDFDWEALEAEFTTDKAGDVTDVSRLDDASLLNLFNDCNTELGQLREEMEPRTDRGREVHSLRAAARIELARRKIL